MSDHGDQWLELPGANILHPVVLSASLWVLGCQVCDLAPSNHIDAE